MSKQAMATKNSVVAVLKDIPDPEIGVSIYDLGLVYSVEVKADTVHIRMTLTSLGCPLFDQIATEIRKKVGVLKGVKNVEIELTFEPPWSADKMSEYAKTQLGFV